MESIFKLYETYTEKSESPEVFHAWCCIGSIISALGKNVCIDFRAYKVYPNEYIILVAGSATCRKSRALAFSTDLLHELADPPPMSSQKITHEALIGVMNLNNGVCTVNSSELAVFLGADALGSGLLGTLCDLYDYSKRPWSYHTKARNIEEVPDPLLNIFGASTMEWLGWLLPRGASAAGFTSRVLFIYGKERRFKNALPYMGPRQLEAQAKLVERLNEVRTLKGTFALTPEAREYYIDWYEKQEDIPGLGMGGYSGRKQTHVLKLSMAIAAADSLELDIEQSHLRAAVKLLEQMELLLPEVYGEIHATEFGKDTKIVLELIQKADRMPHRNLQKVVWRYMKAADLKEATDTLLQAGLIDVTLEGPHKQMIYTSIDSPIVTIEEGEDTN